MANYALPATSKYFIGKRYSRMYDDLHLGGMSQRTVHAYLRSVRQLADFCQTTPDKVTEAQLRRFFLHLKNERNFAPLLFQRLIVVRETRRQSMSTKMSMNFVIGSLLCECVMAAPGVLRAIVPNSTGGFRSVRGLAGWVNDR